MRGYVYLICNAATGSFKIGVTSGSIENRMKKLQTGNDNELHIVSWYESRHPFKIEKMLHRKYFAKRKLNEWFELESEDVFGFREECRRMEKLLESIDDNPFIKW